MKILRKSDQHPDWPRHSTIQVW